MSKKKKYAYQIMGENRATSVESTTHPGKILFSPERIVIVPNIDPTRVSEDVFIFTDLWEAIVAVDLEIQQQYKDHNVDPETGHADWTSAAANWGETKEYTRMTIALKSGAGIKIDISAPADEAVSAIYEADGEKWIRGRGGLLHLLVFPCAIATIRYGGPHG